MSDQKLLAIFDVTMKGKEEQFSVYGEYEMEKDCLDIREVPVFYNACAYHIVEGKEIPYRPESFTWSGRQICVEDICVLFVLWLNQNHFYHFKV